MEISIIQPSSKEEFDQYYLLRWKLLRKPWNQPRNVNPVEDDYSSVHFMGITPQYEAVAICRLHFNTPQEAQVRFVAVSDHVQGKGIGKKIMASAEHYAKNNGAQKMILHARENAVLFYKSLNYTIIEKSYLLFDEIQHYLMEKAL